MPTQCSGSRQESEMSNFANSELGEKQAGWIKHLTQQTELLGLVILFLLLFLN